MSCMCGCIAYTPKCNTTLNILKNIYISQVNDMFTPKPAKLDKHIH